MGKLEFHSVTKRFGAVMAVENISFEAADGEFVVLVGPSGCGKTTLLRLVAGLEQPTSGEIRMDGRRLNELTPRERNVAMVFQDYALYPHMTVFKNIAFSLAARRMRKDEIRRRVENVARTLGLDTLLQRRPAELSGGQRQRVAMGRAIVREPEAFLFDEPLSNLDAKLRVHMRTEIRALCKRLAITALYVTHDQVEAMTMADRIVILNEGVVQQIGAPDEVYRKPANRFVAGFIGSPAMNFLHGRTRRKEDGWILASDTGDLQLPIALVARAGEREQEVWLGFRPETVEIDTASAERLCLKGRILASELLGRERVLVVETGFGNLKVIVSPESTASGEVLLSVAAEDVHLFRE